LGAEHLVEKVEVRLDFFIDLLESMAEMYEGYDFVPLSYFKVLIAIVKKLSFGEDLPFNSV
jgi:hypothetical protein